MYVCVCVPACLKLLSAHDGVTCRNLGSKMKTTTAVFENCQHLSGTVPSRQDQEYKAAKPTKGGRVVLEPKTEFFATKLNGVTSLKKKLCEQLNGRWTSTCSVLRQSVLCHDRAPVNASPRNFLITDPCHGSTVPLTTSPCSVLRQELLCQLTELPSTPHRES